MSTAADTQLDILVLNLLDFDPGCANNNCEAAADWSVFRYHVAGSICDEGLLCDAHWTEYKKYEDIIFTSPLALQNGVAPVCKTHQLMVKRAEGNRL